MPPRIKLQLHITGTCNLRCKHCYRPEDNHDTLSFGEIHEVVRQYLELQAYYRELHPDAIRGHVNITGGEPMFHPQFAQIIELLGQHAHDFRYGVLTNGTLIDQKNAQLLRDTGAAYVQLSLDGTQKMHDSLRAPGNFERTLESVALLRSFGIPVHISFTANRQNLGCLPELARICDRAGVTKLWTDRVVPIGHGAETEELRMGPEHMPEYLHMIAKAKGGRLTKLLHPNTCIVADRALQFVDGECNGYVCSAGVNLVTVDEKGRILPCRRMPIDCGNIRETTLTDVYRTNTVFQDLQRQTVPKECVLCSFCEVCRGGARCQSYAETGDYRRADPACERREFF